ncbi:MAG: hypothetical protein ACK5Q5_00305 [Planctomycetaceae bacterium]
MRFDRRVRPSPYLNRGDQFRLLRLVALIGLVLVLIQVAGRPSSWNWFFALSSPQAAAAASPAKDFGGPLTPLDIKRPKTAATLPHDAFFGRVADNSDIAADAGKPSGEPSPQVESTAERLPEAMFDGVVDDWLGTTRAEQNALVEVARQIDFQGLPAIQAAADRETTFDALVGRPEYFRGRPITLSGRLRRLTRGSIGVGEEAREVWEAWIVASDSHKTPYLVYCLDVPSGLPTGERIDELVSWSGYYIRRYAYASVGGESVTALMMAPTLNWTPPPATPVAQQLNQEMQWTTLLVVGTLAAVLLMIGGWYLLNDRRYRRSRLHAIGESRLDVTAEDLQALDKLDGGDPHNIQINEPTEQTASP